MQTTIEEFKTTKALVLHLLDTEERCRNEDKYLTYRVFETIARRNGYNGIFIPFAIWDKFPAFETVKRVRAHIQNDEKRYPPTDVSTQRRRQRQNDIQRLTGGGHL